MHQKNFTALFAVVMILLLIPFLPAFIEQRFSDSEKISDFPAIPTTYAATGNSKQINDYISTGYVGNYSFPSIFPEDSPRPQILGIATERNASPPLYQAKEINRSNGVLDLNPGQAVTVWVDFLNTGTATWYNAGEHFVAINLAGPTSRHSAFQHEFWKEYYYRPTRLLQSQVRPGELGRFRFALQAPEQKGIYHEQFGLVAEDLTWIEGGWFELLIGVDESVDRPPDYQAQEVERSKGDLIEVDPGQAFTFWVDFENTGLKNWYNSDAHFIALNVTDPVGRVSTFKHDYWEEYYYRPTRLSQSRIYPGETGRFRFAMQAPNIDGYYTEKFALVSENLLWIPGGKITLNLKVGDPVEPLDYSIEDEPVVRIGLYNTTESITVTANGEYTVTNMNSEQAGTKLAKTITSIDPEENSYWRLTPTSADTIMEITNFDNSPLWNLDLNDNTYRGTIEIRYSEQSDEVWVINELPLESYLKGLAEVANEQPEQYLKSLTIAARSYILWHYLRGGKHPDNHFDINANTDQVYRGYGFEQRSEDPLAAVLETAGLVITHPDAVTQINPYGIAIAAYSSGTDGRTRTWNEVWAGSGFPWLVSVDDPYGYISNWNILDANHMVGMSAKGARGYATEENKTYDWILNHYYTGVEVEKIY